MPGVSGNDGGSGELTTAGPTQWSNFHGTFTQAVRGLFQPTQPGIAATSDAYAAHRASTASIQSFIQSTMEAGHHLRGLGSRWSFSRVAATPDFQLENLALELVLELEDELIDPRYRGEREHVVLVQAGIRIERLNDVLTDRKKSLPTSGASDGQTIAGALSTGSHGAAIRFGAIADFVVGLQVATGDGKSKWLEASDSPVATDALLDKLDAERLGTSDTFRAALVNLGAFGVLVAVAIEVRKPLNLLERRKHLPLDAALRKAMREGDVSGLPHPSSGEEPHHFDVIVNPYAGGARDQAFVTIMHEVDDSCPHSPDSVHRRGTDEDAGRVLREILETAWSEAGMWLKRALGSEMKKLLGTEDPINLFIRLFPKLDVFCARGFWDDVLPKIVTALIKQQYPDGHELCAPHARIFHGADQRTGVQSMAVAVAAADSTRTLDLMIRVLGEGRPIPAGFGNRFVKGSEALFGLNRFPDTCIIEVDGIDCDRMWNYYRRVWTAIESEGIDHAIHWGKTYEWTPTRTRARSTSARLDAWLRERRVILPTEAQRRVFDNAFMATAGLDV